jgi:hypothetical protein
VRACTREHRRRAIHPDHAAVGAGASGSRARGDSRAAGDVEHLLAGGHRDGSDQQLGAWREHAGHQVAVVVLGHGARPVHPATLTLAARELDRF